MSKLPKLLLTLLVVFGLTIAVLTTASASRPKSKTTQGQTTQAANPGRAYESSFVAVTPCRIVDTRKASPGLLTDGASRPFRVRGTGMLGQGGPSAGCGVPAGATAISANVTVTGQTKNGYLVGWVPGTPPPLANFVSYRTGNTTTVNPTLPLAAAGTEPSLTIGNRGSAVHVIIDVSGYYISPVEGQLNSDGTIYAATPRVLSSARTSTGQYQLVIDTDVNLCAVTATSYYKKVTVSAITDGHNVNIAASDIDGSLLDAALNFVVSC